MVESQLRDGELKKYPNRGSGNMRGEGKMRASGKWKYKLGDKVYVNKADGQRAVDLIVR